MKEAFIAGGFGMYPTLIAGLALLFTSLRYASRPESRYVPLMLTLGLFTIFAGGLGFITGVMNLLRAYAGPLAAQGPSVLYLGLQEALHNVALALLLSTTSAIAASIGAWRLARQAQATAPASLPVR
ncbi:hypothetical protein [Archangium lansingense]|uniref:MotA/TolQ/ExbB proton channel domain-containing protein n=1 Tax=Archangium lansingense TaxID=2995310 RepID=A0ABT4AAF4_9BACT|nr:hypothetical protein [Archangium lansinium]MCY1077917.1 hypothetical protein [Archangium lansinium]